MKQLVLILAFALIAGCSSSVKEPKVTTTRPSARPVFNKGMQSFLAGDMTSAIAVWRQYVVSRPSAPDVGEIYYWIGLGERKEDHHFQAIFSFGEAASHGVSQEVLPLLLYHHGHALFETRQYTHAEVKFSELLNAYQGVGEEDKTLYCYGICLQQNGERKDAEKIFKRLIIDYPQSPLAERAAHKTRHKGSEYVVQVGAFKNYATAKNILAEIKQLSFVKKQSLNPHIARESRQGVMLYCVRVGFLQDWDSAHDVADILTKFHYETLILP